MLPTLSSAVLARALPFAAFMALLALRGQSPADDSWGFDTQWIYAAKLLLVGSLLAWWWREYGELAWQNRPTLREAAFAAAVGALVFVLWIHLDAAWMTIDAVTARPFVPLDAQGQIIWSLALMRIAGSTLLVPVMEELFWRSLLMRWIRHPIFQGVDPRHVGLRAILLSTFIFVLAHTLWLAAAIAGLAYAWLYVRSGKLWLAVIAHAATNGMLAVWVLGTGNWQFW